MTFVSWAEKCVGDTWERQKLPNSGDLLKLLVPSSCWKMICGWTNYLGKVTTQKMSENEMDNRGSKSVTFTVKEQRVDGSWQGISFPCLRCTLMDFEKGRRYFGLFSNIIESSTVKTPTKVSLNINSTALSKINMLIRLPISLFRPAASQHRPAN